MVINMQKSFKLKESRKHGDANFPFAQYRFKQKNNIIVTEHWHNETELLYVKSGTLNIMVNKKGYTCAEGEMVFINSGELHSVDGNNIHYYAMVFNPDMLSFSLDDDVQKNILRPFAENEILFFNKPKISADIAWIIDDIIKINTEYPQGYMLETKALLLMLINRLFCAGMYSRKNLSVYETETEHRLKAILAYIGNHYSENLSLSDISREFNMSPKYFCRFFKTHFNKTFVEYLNLVRVENALKLMNSEDIYITEVGMLCGFSNMSYFTKTFKKAVGQTPSAYKKTLAAENVISHRELLKIGNKST